MRERQLMMMSSMTKVTKECDDKKDAHLNSLCTDIRWVCGRPTEHRQCLDGDGGS